MVTLSLNYTGAQSLQENILYGTRDYITVPVRNGYHFIGWMLNNEIVTDSNGQLYEPWNHTETVTLYAIWNANSYNFILDFSHLDGFNETIVSASSNDIKYIVFTPSRSGNICLWTSHITGDPYLYLYDSNLNVLAYNDDGYGNRDSKITYSVNSNTEYRIGFRAYGSTSTTGIVYLGYEFGAVYDSAMPSIGLSLPSKDHYTFNGYYSGVNGSGVKYYNSDMSSACVWNIANDTTTLYAHFVPIQYNITWVIPSTTYDGKTIDNALSSRNRFYKDNQFITFTQRIKTS